MEINIVLEDEEEEILSEVVNQYAYFLGRELNEDEIELLFKNIFLQGVKNRMEIWLFAIYAMGGFQKYYEPGWRSYSMEEIDEQDFDEIPVDSLC